MYKLIYLFLALFICFALILPGCAPAAKVRALTPAEEGLVESSNNFGLKLFREIVDQEGDKNVFISPLSVAMALGMTLNGAAGETSEAMKQALELAGLTEDEINKSYRSLIELLMGLDAKVDFRLANSVWYRQDISFRQQFLDICRDYFDAEVSGRDFSTIDTLNAINSWVDDKTNGKITEILDEIDADSVMFLINAIYFKGTWTYRFDEAMTQSDLFTVPGGSQVECRMMRLTGNLPYYAGENFQAVDLPYGNGDYSMTILLPGPQHDVDSLIADLTDSNWQQWTGNFAEEEVNLSLPKFTLEYELKLNDVLEALGMGIAFSGMADFSNMREGGGLYIDTVKHKTFVNVDEEGTEAAAVTIVDMRLTAMPSPIEMRIDRPFVFAIREHHSNTILFMGKIIEPTLE